MFKWLFNLITGNGYLNESSIKKEAKNDTKNGLILEDDVPTVFEQKLLQYYQSKILELKTDKTKTLNNVLALGDVNKIDTFISKCAEKEDRFVKMAQAASNTYRREYIKLLPNESKAGLTLDVDKHIDRYFDLPKEVRSLSDYNAVVQAKSDAKMILSNYKSVENTLNTFIEKTAKSAQEILNAFYQENNKLAELMERYQQKNITQSQLQNKIKILKSKEQDLVSKVYHTLFLYKNVLSTLVNITTDQAYNTDMVDLRSKLRLYYDVNLNIDSIEELNVIEKAQNDALDEIPLFQIDGSFSSYELYLRDQHQRKIDEYYKLHGMQYRHLEDEAYLTQEATEDNDVTYNHYNTLIIEQGIIFETQVESQFTKLIHLYRSEYVRLKKDISQYTEIPTKLNLKPVLKFYFKNIENETLNIQDINSAATEDAALSQNTLDTATPYMYYIQKKYQKIIEQNYQKYSVEINTLKSKTNINTKNEINTLIATHKKEEILHLNRYHEFQLIYIREFLNRKLTQNNHQNKTEFTEESDQTNIIPSLQLYFTDIYEQKTAITDEEIVDMGQKDAKKQIATTLFPDYTYNEKLIRNTYQKLIDELDIYSSDILDHFESHIKSIEVEYHSKIDKYRDTYLASSEDMDKNIFQFGYLPLETLKKTQEDYITDKFTLFKITEAVIIDVKNGIKSCGFIKNVINEYLFFIDQNYKKFLQTGEEKIEIVTGMLVDNTNTAHYHEYANKESLILQEMQKIISKYIELYEIYSKSVNLDENFDFDACLIPVELFFDSDVTEEKTIRQAQIDCKMKINKAPTSYQKKINVFFRRKLFEVKIAYLDKIKTAKDSYVMTGDSNHLSILREKESLEKEMIISEYNQIMNLYLSENSEIKDYTIPSLV